MIYSLHPRWFVPALCAVALTTAPAISARAAAPDTAALLKQGRAAGLRAALAAHLVGLEKSGAPESLIKDDAYRTALAAHEVLRVTGEKPVAALLAKYPDFNNFLAAFLRGREWMEAYLASGIVPTDTEFGLEALYRIWKADGGSADFGKYKHLSASLGAVFGGEGKRAEALREGLTRKPFNIDPVWRFKFFKAAHKAGRLHPMFAGLKSWELRYVVEKGWDDTSYAWLNENINIPLQQYTRAYESEAVRYRGDNDFGDTIQGPLFYTPWGNLMSAAENTRVHGGVCGSISTFGATMASAHGVPAYTVGSPSHCAYAVRFARGDWRGAFGGPDGGVHTVAAWAGGIHFVNLMEAVFGDDAGLNLAVAHAARARLLVESGDMARAQKAIDAALAASPLHLDLRRERFAILEKSGRMTPADWRRHAEELLALYGTHGEPAIELIRPLEPKFLDGAGDAEKLDWYAKVHAVAARSPTLGSWGWTFDEKILNPQLASLKSDASREALLRLCLGAYLDCQDGAFFGTIIKWGVKTFVENGKGDAFFNAFSTALAGGAGKLDDKKFRAICEKGVVAACAAKSVPAFQSVSKLGLRLASRPRGSVKLDLPPGKLVSSEGMLTPSTQAWCSPLDFYNVLNETGGLVHTKEEATPSVVVELPRTVELSGILVVKSDGNEGRMKKVRVSRSVDGESWFPIEETPAMPKQWRINPPPDTRARWIKIEALNERPEHLHFRNILVFSKE